MPGRETSLLNERKMQKSDGEVETSLRVDLHVMIVLCKGTGSSSRSVCCQRLDSQSTVCGDGSYRIHEPVEQQSATFL